MARRILRRTATHAGATNAIATIINIPTDTQSPPAASAPYEHVKMPEAHETKTQNQATQAREEQSARDELPQNNDA